MELTPILIGAIAGVATGAGVAYLIFTKMLSKKAVGIIKEAEDKGENIKQAKLLQAKEKFLSMKEEHGTESKIATVSCNLQKTASKQRVSAL